MTDTAPRQAAVRQSLSVGVATALYGLSLGALAVASGLTVWQACVTSLLLFSGGSQFALVGVLGGGGSVGAAVAASSLLGVRNGLYGLQLATLLQPKGWRRLAAAHLTIDESTAVAIAQPSPETRSTGFWVTGLTVFVGWNLMTFAGALLGNAIGDPRKYGLDAAGRRCLSRPALAAAARPPGRGRGSCWSPRRRRPCPGRRGRTSRGGSSSRRRAVRVAATMSRVWIAVLVASLVSYGLKLSGYLVPARAAAAPRRRPHRAPAAGGTASPRWSWWQTFSSGARLTVDARVAGLAVAALALVLRAPFLVVVVAAAATAALVRATGWG